MEAADSAGVDFTWEAPFSWGTAGPSPTNRYAYEVRETVVGGPGLSDTPGDPTGWSLNPRLINTASVNIAWQSGLNQEIVQIRLYSRDSNGVLSPFVLSEIITETV